MKVFLWVFFCFLALVAWFTGAAIAATWVGGTFGDDWSAVPVLASFAPVVAFVVAYWLGDW